jgi:hypothetical protein
LNHLNKKKTAAAGYEVISGRILKYSARAITKPLSHICSASLNQGIYYDKLKFALVKPISTIGENLM